MSEITFSPFLKKDIPLYTTWAEKEHVKQTWFLNGYEPVEYIYKKIEGNGYDYPFIIFWNQRPIGYIKYSDLYAYKTLEPNPRGVFTDEPKGTFCIDLFIGEEDCLGKGLGTKIVQEFCHFLFENAEVRRIVIDPAVSNERAIHCYKKVGFKPLKEANDGVTQVQILELVRPVGEIPKRLPKSFSIDVDQLLSLRLPATDQASLLFSLVEENRDHLREFLGWLDSSKTLEDTKKFIETDIERSLTLRALTLTIWLKDKPVGLIGLHSIDRLNHNTSLGYWIGESKQGKGLMTKSVLSLVDFVFYNLGLKRIEARSAIQNHRSQKVLERCGFSQEGLLKQAIAHYGNYFDAFIYSKIKDTSVQKP